MFKIKQKIKQKIYNDFNIKKQADDLGIKIWQTPSFLFIIMGFIIIFAMTGTYIVSSHYDSPEILVISESLVVVLLLVVGNSIIRTVEEVSKSNKMKSEFVSIASHQLKTPISEMKWQIELLLSKFADGLNEKQKELIGGIAHSGEKMGRLINDLLDVARIDQGQLALTKEEMNFCSMVEDAIDAQRSFAKEMGVDLVFACNLKKLSVIVDKRRITVVLDNLISNAIKYIDGNGKVEVIIEESDGFAQFCIRDNGVGIPVKEQEDICQKFFRSNNSIKNKTDGTGLGLYIAKNIVEQSGGKLWFKSIENVGSEFYFSLPLMVVEKKGLKTVE
jgi:signal transduction histidine kinase